MDRVASPANAQPYSGVHGLECWLGVKYIKVATYACLVLHL